MSVRSVTRVVLVVGVFVGAGLPLTGLVRAAEKEINATLDAARCDKKWGPPCFTPANGTVTEVTAGDTVTWRALDGTHTVTPVDPEAFSDSGDLTGPDATFSVTFERPGVYSFYCRHHGSVEDNGKIHHGMWGKIDVKPGDDTTTTTTTTTTAPPPPPPPPPGPPATEPPPKPAPTQPPPPPPSSGSPSSGSTAPGNSSSSAHGQTAAETGRPYVGPPPTTRPQNPPPTRAAAAEPPEPKKPERERNGGPDSTAAPDPTAIPPDELVLPPSPQFAPPTTTPVAEAPDEVPDGDSVAVLKNESHGGRRKLVLFATVFGVGAFAFGVGAWKYATRPSKYWPA